MDKRSWLWRKRSSEKSPGGETESSGSLSSHSERYSDDQELSRASPVHNTQSPEVTSKSVCSGDEVNDHVKSLTEKLSAALLNISAKEDLVKQHAKVAEEAVSGWEKAENEAASFKQQLEATAQKNSALEDRVSHLDGALKECVRQLRQAREDQEQKIHEAVVKKSYEWEFTKVELENQIDELQLQVEAAKTQPAALSDPDLRPKLEAAEKENSSLKHELLARAEELEIMILERDLSIQSAETASKQHLESIKKVAKLEAECRKLRAAARKGSLSNDHKSIISSSMCVESVTDSQSDSGERFLAGETDTRKMNSLEPNGCEPSCSDSWASALIAELDQFKTDKATGRNITNSSVEIDLMDDFLEMERLAALPEPESGKSVSDQHNNQSKAQLELMTERAAELEEKLERMESEKTSLEIALAETQTLLESSQNQLKETEENLMNVQMKLDHANAANQATKTEMESLKSKREAAESQLVTTDAEVRTLRAKVDALETEIKDERALSEEIRTKCQTLEDEMSKRRRETELRRVAKSNGELKIKQEKELAVAAGKLAECQKTIASLGQQLKSLATLEDFMIDHEKPQEHSVGSPIPKNSGELWKLHSNDAYFPKTDGETSKMIAVDGVGPSMNGKNGESPPSSSSSSSSSSVSHSLMSEKSRTGLSKLFSRNKSASRTENL